MDELKSATKGIFIFTVILVLTGVFNIISDLLSILALSSAFLILISVCLTVYYKETVDNRGGLKNIIVSCGVFMLLFNILRAVRYMFCFSADFHRILWYFYYIPMLAIPTLLLYASFLVDSKGEKRTKPNSIFGIVSVILLSFVLTNDLHQSVFHFKSDVSLWNPLYTYGPVYYVVAFWIGLLYLLTLIVITKKCMLTSARKCWWVMTIPYVITIPLLLLNVTGNLPKFKGNMILMFPEIMCYMMAVFIQCGISLGLIPIKIDFLKILKVTSLPIKLTDDKNGAEYISESAYGFSTEENKQNDDTVLHKMKIGIGTGFWWEDVSEINKVNRELQEANEKLTKEADIIKLNNELSEKQTVIRHRTRLYDDIDIKNTDLIRKISEITSVTEADSVNYNENMLQICLFGVFMKRYSNLLLLAEQSEKIYLSELGISIAETLRYLTRLNVITQYKSLNEPIFISSEIALVIFEWYKENVINHFKDIKGLYVSLENENDAIMKFVVEGSDYIADKEFICKMNGISVTAFSDCEDGTSFIRFCLPKVGGDVNA